MAELSAHLGARLWKLAQDHPKLLGEAMVFGAIFTVAVRGRARPRALYAALFRHRVLAHSICETEPPTLILIPPLLMSAAEAELVAAALDRAAQEVAP